MRIRGALMTTTFSWTWVWMGTVGWHLSPPKGKPPRFTHVLLKGSVHLDTPTIIGWIIDKKCTENQLLRRSPRWIVYTIQILGSLTSKFWCDLDKGLGFKPPMDDIYKIGWKMMENIWMISNLCQVNHKRKHIRFPPSTNVHDYVSYYLPKYKFS